MSIYYNSVYTYKTLFDGQYVEDRGEAHILDWNAAAQIIHSARLDEILNATREGKGRVFEAIQYLAEVGSALRFHLAEADAKATVSPTPPEPEMASDVVELEAPVGPDTSKPVLDLDRDADPDYTF